MSAPAPSRWRHALRSIRRWLEPPRRLRPTRAGWWFFVITFGVGFAALNTGNNLLYLVLALMLAFLVLSGVLSEAVLRGIAVERCLPAELYAGASCAVGLCIRNTQRRVPAFAVAVEDRLREPGGRPRRGGGVFALRVGAGETLQRVYRFRPERRGSLEFLEFRVVTRFPFGLFSKSLTLRAPACSLVFPELEPVSIPPDFGAARERGEGLSGARGAGALAEGLRGYERGDPHRRIHWPVSLRRGELLVRELEDERRPEVEVRLRTDVAAGQAFERAVSWAASEIAALLDSGTRVALQTTTTRLAAGGGPHQRGRLLAFLACVEPEPAP